MLLNSAERETNSLEIIVSLDMNELLRDEGVVEVEEVCEFEVVIKVDKPVMPPVDPTLELVKEEKVFEVSCEFVLSEASVDDKIMEVEVVDTDGRLLDDIFKPDEDVSDNTLFELCRGDEIDCTGLGKILELVRIFEYVKELSDVQSVTLD